MLTISSCIKDGAGDEGREGGREREEGGVWAVYSLDTVERGLRSLSKYLQSKRESQMSKAVSLDQV